MATMTQRVLGTSDKVQKKVVISPASSNKEVNFNHRAFQRASGTSSLRDAFQQHPAYRAVFPPTSHRSRGFAGSSGVPLGVADEDNRLGDIVALSGRSPHGDGTVGAVLDLSRASQGITSAIMTAYNTHCDLEISPDDVWITILSQFCAYVNKNAEALRDKIVDHEGKKELVAYSGGSLRTANYEGMIRDLLKQIRQNIKSPELADWFRPGFTTTTTRDEVCAAATAMATMQAYFEYRMVCLCGIPSVTLTGTVDDWKLLRVKIERLVEFEVEGNPEGKVMEQWVGYLRKVCDGFVESAEHPDSAETLEFWDKVLSHIRRGSGMNYTTGWVSAFSCFDKDGNFIGKRKNENGEFPLIRDSQLCHNVVSCPVTIDDNGKLYDGTLFTGQVVFEVERGEAEGRPTVRPRNDWCMAATPKK